MAELDAPSPGTRGSGRYPAYHALWHLFEIGVIEDPATFAAPAWVKVETARAAPGAPPPTRVALIDTSVAMDHPNLAPAIEGGLALDLFSARHGAFPRPGPALPPELAPAAARPAPIAAAQPYLDRLAEGLRAAHAAGQDPAPRPGTVFPATRASFSAHGTAMAGLIGARPRAAAEVPMVGPTLMDLPGGTPLALPAPAGGLGFAYAGVDPYCRIVPVSTHFDPEPEQLILALLYAWMIRADLIVLAREVPAPAAVTPPLPGEPADLRERLSARLGVGLAAAEIVGWQVLEALILEISKTIPILCAAGNSGEERMAYPASLAAPGNGIIAVGAHASTGQPSAFSAGGTGTPVTVFAPSGDGERLDERIARLDPNSAGFRAWEQGSGYAGAIDSVPTTRDISASTYSPLEIVTTDVPGRAGYNGSAFTGLATEAGAVLDYRSYYCHFSGTSAATAIAGGMLSLAMSAGVIPRGQGPLAKELLQGPGVPNAALATPKLRWSRIPGAT
ncbi:S8 family serine peptidase [Frigidibacter sp. MR17.24]|uniref:S8 family serine peptidase n=1 Tax=Frigidibacter sp. MR17.24 TaxID=3127345 RepID=UPI003012B76D